MTAQTGKAVLLLFTAIGLLLLSRPAMAAMPSMLPEQEAKATADIVDEETSDIKAAVSKLIADEVQQALGEQPAGTTGQKALQHKTNLRLIDVWFNNGLENFDFLLSRFRYQMDGFPQLPDAFAAVWRAVGDQGVIPPLRLAVLVTLVISLSLTIEFFSRRLSRSYRYRFTQNNGPSTLISRWGRICVYALFEAAFLAIYAYSSLTLYYFFLPGSGTAHLVAGNLVMASYLIRLVYFVTTILLAPTSGMLRLIPFSDWGASFLARWIVLSSIPIVVLIRFGVIFNRLELDTPIFLSLIGLVIFFTYLVFICVILISKNKVRASIEQTVTDADPSIIKSLAAIWHIPSLLLVTLLILNWELRLLTTGKIYFGKVLSSCLLIIFFFAVDYWGQKLLKLTLRGGAGLLSSFTDQDVKRERKGKQFSQNLVAGHSQRIIIAYRILLLALCIFSLFSLWDINVTLGRTFTLGALSILTIVVVAYLIWQLFKIWIDSKISAEMPNQEESDEGGKGGSRRATLLLLLRKAFLSLLFVVTFMALLSALGINIIPLVAGAGILGLAISFGAQSLIADIFAGIFFLIDDAFRVGDYVDCGGTKGTVEHISLRSLRLRHHRGMVHTLPFGKINSVTNYTRDYIIMKLDIRVRYDTDVDKVRKIIKRMYLELQQDPIHGPKLIGKLKSQGVREMDDSAMIMRVKFTTRPGDQFELRREVFRRIQEAFRENNIEFAHRNVTVYMPPGEEQHGITPSQEAKQRGAAAGASLLQAEEDLLRQKAQRPES